MTERQPTANEYCALCPNRNPFGRWFASALNNNQLGSGCEGPVTIRRVPLITADTAKGDKALTRINWSTGTRSTKYGKTRKETVCGRSDIGPHENEVPYDPFSDDIIREVEGVRHAAFVTGTPEQLDEYKTIRAISDLLDGEAS